MNGSELPIAAPTSILVARRQCYTTTNMTWMRLQAVRSLPIIRFGILENTSFLYYPVESDKSQRNGVIL